MITKWVARTQYNKGLRAIEREDLDSLLGQFDRRCSLVFVGDTPLGASLSTPAGVRQWFERFLRLLPDRRFEVDQLLVNGPPWDLRLAARVIIRSTVDDRPYENQFAHFLRLRWGKVVDDFILEDTQRWSQACQRLTEAGVAEAAEGPIVDDRQVAV